MQLPWNDIGGGFVARGFIVRGDRLAVGKKLTASEIAGFGNFRALIRAGFLRVFPPDGDAKAAPIAGRPIRHVVHTGGGRHIVIAGVKLHDDYLSKEEAEALAARSD